jgi:hypothetical protein
MLTCIRYHIRSVVRDGICLDFDQPIRRSRVNDSRRRSITRFGRAYLFHNSGHAYSALQVMLACPSRSLRKRQRKRLLSRNGGTLTGREKSRAYSFQKAENRLITLTNHAQPTSERADANRLQAVGFARHRRSPNRPESQRPKVNR